MPGSSEPAARLTEIGAVPVPLVGVTRSQELLVRAVQDAVPDVRVTIIVWAGVDDATVAPDLTAEKERRPRSTE